MEKELIELMIMRVNLHRIEIGQGCGIIRANS